MRRGDRREREGGRERRQGRRHATRYADVRSQRREATDHPHLRKVEESSVFREVGSPFLDEGQVGQVHPQVGDAGGITAVQGLSHVAEPAIRRDERLQLIDRLTGLLVATTAAATATTTVQWQSRGRERE